MRSHFGEGRLRGVQAVVVQCDQIDHIESTLILCKRCGGDAPRRKRHGFRVLDQQLHGRYRDKEPNNELPRLGPLDGDHPGGLTSSSSSVVLLALFKEINDCETPTRGDGPANKKNKQKRTLVRVR